MFAGYNGIVQKKTLIILIDDVLHNYCHYYEEVKNDLCKSITNLLLSADRSVSPVSTII